MFMSEFDAKAQEWDKDQMHVDRANVIAAKMQEIIPMNNSMRAMEFGTGTGLLSFCLKDKLKHITLIDNSQVSDSANPSYSNRFLSINCGSRFLSTDVLVSLIF